MRRDSGRAPGAVAFGVVASVAAALGGILCLAVLLTGCAGTTAPQGWLSTPAQAESLAYGGWIRLETEKPPKFVYEGELLAVHGDSSYVLEWNDSVQAVALLDVTRGRLTAYDPKTGTIALWSTIGTLSTASHGIVAIFSAPIWILTGSLATASTSRKGKVDYPKRTWHELAVHARFPQGLPTAVRETRTLQGKPLRERRR